VFEQIPKSTTPRVRPPSPYLGGTALVDATEETIGDKGFNELNSISFNYIHSIWASSDVCNFILAFKVSLKSENKSGGNTV